MILKSYKQNSHKKECILYPKSIVESAHAPTLANELPSIEFASGAVGQIKFLEVRMERF